MTQLAENFFFLSLFWEKAANWLNVESNDLIVSFRETASFLDWIDSLNVPFLAPYFHPRLQQQPCAMNNVKKKKTTLWISEQTAYLTLCLQSSLVLPTLTFSFLRGLVLCLPIPTWEQCQGGIRRYPLWHHKGLTAPCANKHVSKNTLCKKV